jgi:hypothetical protein
MLSGLGRWLRAAGYDTDKAERGEHDRALLVLAEREGRVFLTRDGSIARLPTAGAVWMLARGGLEAEARELTARGVDWLHAPFTRCLADNTPLAQAGPAELARMPRESRELPGPHRACPECGRVYWPGSHVRRMQATLARWAGRGA